MPKVKPQEFAFRKPETLIWLTETRDLGMWVCSPPTWFIPADRIAPQLGLDKPGLYVMRASRSREMRPPLSWWNVEYVRAMKSNLQPLFDSLAFYSDQKKLAGETNFGTV